MPRHKNIETESGKKLHAEKFSRILEAALDVFAEKGFHESKISEIAKRADVGDGTIYLYFKNKDDLLISLFETKLELINRGLQQELQKIPDVRERLRHVVRYHLQLAIEDPKLAAFITIELRRSAKFVKDYAKAQFAAYLDQWVQVLRDGQASGEFRSDVRVGIFKHFLFGALDQVCVTWVNSADRRPEYLVEVGDQLIELMLSALTVK